MTKFHKQARQEFGRASLAGAQQAQQQAQAASTAAAGQAVASFYASLVNTSGKRWVSGGTLADSGAASVSVEPPAADSAEPSHAGLGSAAARAELAAEERQLQYNQPAGPLLRGQQEAQPPAADADRQHQQQQRRAPVEGLKYGIARSNVGFQLLKKAGWTEGTGLGAQEQGVVEPVSAFQQKGNLGLGYAPKPKPQAQQGAATAAAASGKQQQQGAAAQKQQQQQQQPKRPLPEDPLEKEAKETKVKRVRQVLQAEADDKAGKAIARYMYMAFNDATGEPTRDSNPLLRRNHKLSATNPLL